MKTKTVTKEFWVSDDFINQNKNIEGFMFYIKESFYYKNKVKVTFEVPEKQVTITESELDDMISVLGYKDHAYVNLLIFPNDLKQKLFGDKNE